MFINYKYNFYRAEIESLEQAVTKERARYQMSTQALSSGLSAISLLPINDSVCFFKIKNDFKT